MRAASGSGGTPRLDVVCGGPAGEMGRVQGAALRGKVHDALHCLARLEAFRLMQPWWMPYFLYRRAAEAKARTFLHSALARHLPSAAERMAGIAEGAGISAGAAALLNALEPAMADAHSVSEVPGPGACSALAVRGPRSKTGEPIVARNFDYLPLVQPFYVLREDRPAGGLRSLQFTLAPLAGAVDGVNESGLCITYNYAFATDGGRPAPPLSMLVAEALARCTSTAEAAEWLVSRPRSGAGLLLLADAMGEIASLELSATRSHLRRPAAGEDCLFHTNCYTSDAMREVEVASGAVFTERAPRALRSHRVLQSAERRQERFARLLGDRAALGSEDLARLMADHGETGEPDNDTICMHGGYWYTTASLQWYPASRRVRVAYATACQARFVEIALGDRS